MAHRTNIILEDNLYRELSKHAQARGLTVAQTVRDLLRQSLGAATPQQSGFREGFMNGMREVHTAVGAAFKRLGA